ncbi:MAG: alkaline phosphatase [Saprospiraceae bacterium]|nr:MAG: alkaline phosphatase [Saprospiraceae bacterium]
MGLAQITAAMYNNGNHLSLEKFPVVGFHKSYSANDLITDSAAGATAFSCGVKTYNNAIGLSKDSLACKTILEEAEERGLATGLVATSTIVHATPAAFIAHQKLRVLYENIASDMLNVDVDLLIGGGKKYFDRRENDQRDLYQELKDKGYRVYDYSTRPLEEIIPDKKRNLVYFTADNLPLPVSAGRTYLPIASNLATNFLAKRSENGFFLMIEGSQIDWAGHANEGELLVSEMLDFDKAINKVLDFARKRDDTLVIVTADHETGGMSINQGSVMGELKYGFTSNAHTGTLIPVFAYGPGAALFSGIYENTAIHDKIRKAFGFNTPILPKANSN